MKRFKADLKASGIEFIHIAGHRADFHSLRHTLATNLARAGTAPRVAMEIMRKGVFYAQDKLSHSLLRPERGNQHLRQEAPRWSLAVHLQQDKMIFKLIKASWSKKLC
jgi:hypothetical protein